MTQKLATVSKAYFLFAFVAAIMSASSALSRLPAPSVSPEEYPSLVNCTLEKRAPDIEAMFVAQDRYRDQVRNNSQTGNPDHDPDRVPVATSAGITVEAGRLFGQIIESCHALEVGSPLGFWPDQLVSDWRARMGMRWGFRSNDFDDDESFARCLSRFRKSLVATYLAQRSRSGRQTLYNSFFRQPVCQTAHPGAFKEVRVRKHLLSQNGRPPPRSK